MGGEPKRIIIADDSEVYRSSLRDFINRHEGLLVVTEAECGLKAIEAVRAKQLLKSIWHTLEGKPFVFTPAEGELSVDEIAKLRSGDPV